MGESHHDSLMAAIRAREAEDPALAAGYRRARPQGLVVVVGLLLSPVVLLVAVVCLWFGFLIVAAGALTIDEHLHSVPFEPGRWEARSGEYWVELREDGTGDVRLPDDAAQGVCHQDMMESEATYTFAPSGHGTYGTLDVVLDNPQNPNCFRSGPFLAGGGNWYGGYDWRILNYSIGDPDNIDLTLKRVG